ncbi:MAG: phosphoribosylamine--glycine ligase [Cyclobacteriaceae bacterium]|nr:phosphoribosylamine--glycine ligase [Cyclobacteriaceae bacterium]
MNILLIGNGGREHALAWKIKQSPLSDHLYIAPGNAGTSLVGENLPISVTDFPSLAKACLDKKIGLVVVGPEVPLVKGIRDYFEKDPALKNILIVGPGANGAQLEGSKDFSKQFMVRNNVPTAKAKTFTASGIKEGLQYLADGKLPIVLKADGLAAGKGVIISNDLKEAQASLSEMLVDKLFGEASSQVLVEEFLDGIELSVFVLTDGEDYVILPEAKDYKRIGDNDTGPNTGGMGAVSPVAFADAAFMKKVEEKVIKPTIHGLKKEKIPYRGFIFFGLINVKGEPLVIEYNARMGDPETEAVMTRIDSDFLEVLIACAEGKLKNKNIVTHPDYAVTVMMVSGGYPGDYKKGNTISGLDTKHNALVFHAGTKNADGGVVNDGGRVLAVTGRGKGLEEARNNAYEAISGISWRDVSFRKDIGVDLLKIVKSGG